jgi:hypothetical protein
MSPALVKLVRMVGRRHGGARRRHDGAIGARLTADTGMHLDLTDEETFALLNLLVDTVPLQARHNHAEADHHREETHRDHAGPGAA